jgi:Flp pilus assembly pilin Flp
MMLIGAKAMILNYSLQVLSSIRSDHKGQDLIEYALMAAAVAVSAGAIFPTTITPAVSTIFSKIVSTTSLMP